MLDHLIAHKIKYERERFESATTMGIRLRVEAVNRWYVHDWNTLDNKIRSSIAEGVSVFLSMFDLPSVARVFCPPAPPAPGAASPRFRVRHRPIRSQPGRRNPPAHNCYLAAAGRAGHPEGRSGVEDGAGVDTPGLRRLTGPFSPGMLPDRSQLFANNAEMNRAVRYQSPYPSPQLSLFSG